MLTRLATSKQSNGRGKEEKEEEEQQQQQQQQRQQQQQQRQQQHKQQDPRQPTAARLTRLKKYENLPETELSIGPRPQGPERNIQTIY